MTSDDERPSTVPATGAPPDDRRAGGPVPGGAQVGERQAAQGPPADEAERQAQETVRSISRLEESN